MHEDFTRHHEVRRGSDRSFGVIVSAGLLVLALAPLRHHLAVRWWAVAAAAILGAVAVLRPTALRPLNIGWTALGLALNRVTSPGLLAIVFYGAVLPTGLLMRAFGRRPLRLTRTPGAGSYWIHRTPPGPAPASMKRQF